MRPGPPLDPADLRGLPVLVVDDNATNRRILEEILAHWQMRPTAVESGREALALMRRAVEQGLPFPLVLSDAMMPEMDGFTLAERIKHDPQLAGAADHDALLGRPAQRRRPLPRPGRGQLPDQADQAVGPARRDPAGPAVRRRRRRRRRNGRGPRRRRPARPLRILLAEDNAVNQTLAVHLLRRKRARR